MSIRLCSFADGAFSLAAKRFLIQAEALDIFDEINIYNFNSLASEYVAEHGAFIKSNLRGFGYWVWKPIVIQHLMQCSKPEDVIIYLDVGFQTQVAGKERFLEYISMACDSEYKMLSFQNVHTESSWTKADLSMRLGVLGRPSIMGSSQLSSGFIILCPTSSNLELVREWADLAVENNYHFSDDSHSVVPNVNGFIEHRHDQSIFSLLRKMRGTLITHYEVQAYDQHFYQKQDCLPALASRLRY